MQYKSLFNYIQIGKYHWNEQIYFKGVMMPLGGTK